MYAGYNLDLHTPIPVLRGDGCCFILGEFGVDAGVTETTKRVRGSCLSGCCGEVALDTIRAGLTLGIEQGLHGFTEDEICIADESVLHGHNADAYRDLGRKLGIGECRGINIAHDLVAVFERARQFGVGEYRYEERAVESSEDIVGAREAANLHSDFRQEIIDLHGISLVALTVNRIDVDDDAGDGVVVAS